MTLTHISAELANIRCGLVYAEKDEEVRKAMIDLIDLMHKAVGDQMKGEDKDTENQM